MLEGLRMFMKKLFYKKALKRHYQRYGAAAGTLLFSYYYFHGDSWYEKLYKAFDNIKCNEMCDEE